MPTLYWIGKEAVVKHHEDVPYRLLEPVAGVVTKCGHLARLISRIRMTIHKTKDTH